MSQDNGAFMTRADLATHLKEDWLNGINYRVENNPAAVYGLIHQNYPGEFRSLGRGSEGEPGNREMMLEFLERKANEYPQSSGGPEAFAAWVYAAIPHNVDANNWTTQIV